MTAFAPTILIDPVAMPYKDDHWTCSADQEAVFGVSENDQPITGCRVYPLQAVEHCAQKKVRELRINII